MTMVDPELLARILGQLNDKLKDPRLMVRGDNRNWSDVRVWIPTGSTLMDIVMTSRDEKFGVLGSGWACGRWYEIFGEEGKGKSTLVEHACACVQKIGGIANFLDTESKLDKQRAARIGVDLKRLIMTDAPYVERGIECFTELMEVMQAKPELSAVPILTVWDTIAAAPTKAEYESGMYSGGMADKSRITHAMYRDLTTKLSGFNCCFIMVNQVRDTMGGRYEKQTDTTGGRGSKYMASCRIELKSGGTYTNPDDKEDVQGLTMIVKYVKSSMFKPFAEVKIPLNFHTGIDDLLSLVWFHSQMSGLIQGKGYYTCPGYFGDGTSGKRLGEFMKIVREDDLFQDWLIQRAWDHSKLLWKRAASFVKQEGEGEKQ